MGLLKIIHWNCRGLRNKLDVVTSSLFPPFDILVLQETFLSPEYNVVIPGKVVYRFDRPYRHGGGVLVAVDSRLSSSCIGSSISSSGNELMGVRIFSGSFVVSIVNVYSSSGRIVDDLKQFCQNLQDPLLILGDFNLHHPFWGSRSPSRHSEEFIDWISENSLCLVNTSNFTHVSPNGSRSLLDLSLCSSVLLAKISCLVEDDPFGSDHFPVSLSIGFSFAAPALRVGFVWPRIFEEINRSLSKVNVITYDSFSGLVKHIMDKNKRVHKSPTKYSPPWWNLRCSALLSKKKFFLRKAIQEVSTEYWIRYKKTTALLRRAIKDSKRSFWDSLCKDAHDSSIIFRAFKRIKNRCSTTPDSQHCLLWEGHIVSDATRQCNIFASIFAGNVIHSPIPLTYGTDHDNALNSQFAMSELIEAIHRSKPTSPGEDKIPASVFKNLNNHSLTLLLNMFNSIFSTGEIPSDWTTAVILPFAKPDRPRNDPTSYRPIALTSVACKIFERLIAKRISDFLIGHKKLDYRHLGFLPHRDSNTAITMLQQDIWKALRDKKYILGISLDIKAAYDSVFIDGLIHKCAQMGITGTVLRWIHRFLSHRRIKVAFRNTLSSEFCMYRGVPQGAVLSPILFTIFMSDVFEIFLPGVRILVFADDIFIYFIGDSLLQCHEKLQQALRDLSQWCDYWKLSISPEKSHAINLSRRRGNCDFQFCVNGGLIEWVDEIKFLGFLFTRRGGLRAQVDYLRRKAFKRINILKALANKSYGARSHHLLRVFSASVRSLFDYGAAILNSASDSLLQKMDVVQNSGLRLALGLPKWTPILILRKHADFQPIKYRIRELTFRFWTKHFSLNSWSPIVNHLNLNLEIESEISIDHFQPIAEMFKDLDCCPVHLVNFQLPRTPLEAAVQYHISDFSFQNKDLNESIVTAEFAEFVSSLPTGYEVLATDASKSQSITAIAGCSSDSQFGFRIHNSNSIFTAEALAIGAALDELGWSGRPLVVISDSQSVLVALQGISVNSPRVILWLHNKICQVSSMVSHIRLIWVPGHRGIFLNERADRIAKSIGMNDNYMEWISPEDVCSHIKRIMKANTVNLYKNSKYSVLNGEIPSIRITSVWVRNRREDVMVTRLVCKMTITPAVLLRFNLTDNGVCSVCQRLDSLDHILFSCEKYRQQRIDCFGSQEIGSDRLRVFTVFLTSFCSCPAFRFSTLKFIRVINRF